MRSTRKVSVWPVAFVGGLRYESPKVNAAGKVYGWKTVFDPHRPFAIDMAGFAINLRLILFKPQAYFKLRGVKGGYQESSLLRELVTLSDLEPKAANCTKVRKHCSDYAINDSSLCPSDPCAVFQEKRKHKFWVIFFLFVCFPHNWFHLLGICMHKYVQEICVQKFSTNKSWFTNNFHS